jgi:hypothetical protein
MWGTPGSSIVGTMETTPTTTGTNEATADRFGAGSQPTIPGQWR